MTVSAADARRRPGQAQPKSAMATSVDARCATLARCKTAWRATEYRALAGDMGFLVDGVDRAAAAATAIIDRIHTS